MLYLDLLHKTDIKCHIMTFYCLLPAFLRNATQTTGTVGSTPSTGINGQADRIPQIYTGIQIAFYRYPTLLAIISSQMQWHILNMTAPTASLRRWKKSVNYYQLGTVPLSFIF